MEFEDSRNALFSEPNAYVQKYKCEETKKTIFQEPYDRLPTFYLDNDFQKGNCDCIPKQKNEEKTNCNLPFPFDIKNLFSMLSNLGNNLNLSNLLSNLNGVGGLGSLLNVLTAATQSEQNKKGDGGFNFANIMNLLNNGAGGGIIDLFKSFRKNSEPKSKVKSSDVIIKNYKRI